MVHFSSLCLTINASFWPLKPLKPYRKIAENTNRQGALITMSTTTRNAITFVVGAIIALLVIRWVFHLVLSLVWGLLPIVIVAGVLYVAYKAFSRKALGGGRRTLP